MAGAWEGSAESGDRKRPKKCAEWQQSCESATGETIGRLLIRGWLSHSDYVAFGNRRQQEIQNPLRPSYSPGCYKLSGGPGTQPDMCWTALAYPSAQCQHGRAGPRYASFRTTFRPLGAHHHVSSAPILLLFVPCDAPPSCPPRPPASRPRRRHSRERDAVVRGNLWPRARRPDLKSPIPLS